MLPSVVTALVIILVTILSSSELELPAKKAKVPFKEYWISPTLLSNSNNRAKRKLSCEKFHIDLKDLIKLTLCLIRKTATAYNFIRKNSKLVIHEEDGSVNVTYFSNLNYTILSGYVVGYEHSSKASGFLHQNKQFIGTIDINGSVFYVEDLKDYERVDGLKLKTSDGSSASVIYKRVSAGGLYCPGEAKIPQWKVNESFNKWCKDLPQHITSSNLEEAGDYSGVQVPISIFIDTSYFKFAMSSNGDKAVYSVFKTIETADAIFRSADFMNKRKPNNIGFSIVGITLYKKSVTSPLPEFYPFKRDSTGHLEKFDAQINDKMDNKTILNILYTSQPFKNGVIGISYGASADVWLGTLLSSSTSFYVMKVGICSRIGPSTKLLGFYERSDMKINQYNSIIVTGHDGYATKLSQLHLDLTLVHELGHAFGARHDDQRRCGKGFIMSDHVEKWKSGNMHRFSRCSLDQIHRVLLDRYAGCLSSPNQSKPICGNKIKERGEQCDCGDRYECSFTRSCCFPQDSGVGPPCTMNPKCK